jgi:NADH-quinone oxidoreductase subunit L
MTDGASAVLAIFVPLVGAGVVPVVARLGRRPREATAVGFALGTAALTVLTLFGLGPEPVRAYAWIPVLGIGFDLRIDALGAGIGAIAGTIGLAVVVYSLAYMRHAEEEGYSLARYDALVLLFIGAMIGLALSDSLLALYIFWEIVGLCSFALISFYHRDPNARRAGLKAFAVTRVGDVGLLVALVALWSGAGVVAWSGLEAATVPASLLGVAGVGILLAAVGKSAQVPLHVWLPDAMEAPTPISALIHAATMVNAGVYLVARAFPFFEALGWWPAALLWIGALTAVLAGLSAYVETDLKRVLAYSTISQLGFMVAAVGAGAIFASAFHLLSQAVFKALLFLGAGAVIQAVGTRDLYGMGGLARSMRLTSATFLAGVLAMVGIPVLNGFWSKELLLDAVLEHGAVGPFVLLVLATFVTTAYSWRAYWLVFRGAPRGRPVEREAPRTMTAPLLALAGAAGLSWLVLGPWSASMAAMMPAYPVEARDLVDVGLAIIRWPAILVPSLVVALSVYFILGYADRFERRLEASAPVRLAAGGFLFDAAYRRFAHFLAGGAQRLRGIQTGDLNLNTAGLLGGLAVLLIVLLLEVIG